MKNGDLKIFAFILLVLYQNCSGDHIHYLIFANRVSFIQQESILYADYVLVLIVMYKEPKIAKISQFFILLL